MLGARPRRPVIALKLALVDLHRLQGVTLFDRVHDVLPALRLAEHRVLTVEPRRLPAVRQEQLRLSQLEKRVELEVRQAFIKLKSARAQIESSEAELEVAQQEMAHRRRRYEQGIDGRMELAEAEVQLARATNNRVGALYAWNEARIELMQATGTIRSLAQ